MFGSYWSRLVVLSFLSKFVCELSKMVDIGTMKSEMCPFVFDETR